MTSSVGLVAGPEEWDLESKFASALLIRGSEGWSGDTFLKGCCRVTRAC